MPIDQVFAENVNYWKTSRIAHDKWLEKAQTLIEKTGGEVLGEAFGRTSGRAAFMLAFQLGNDRFKAVWPVLTSKSGDQKAAKVQAATALYHDVKARCVAALFLGTRAAFFCYLMLPDGRTTTEASAPELQAMIPEMWTAPPQLPLDPHVYDAE